MIVQELIAHLHDLPPDMEVFVPYLYNGYINHEAPTLEVITFKPEEVDGSVEMTALIIHTPKTKFYK